MFARAKGNTFRDSVLQSFVECSSSGQLLGDIGGLCEIIGGIINEFYVSACISAFLKRKVIIEKCVK